MAAKITERNDTFWLDLELKLGTFERTWFKDVLLLEQDYEMDSKMEGAKEKLCGIHLALVGPMIDGYLNEIRKAMQAKLSGSNLTGLATPLDCYVP